MKKLLLITFVLIMAVGLTACGKEKSVDYYGNLREKCETKEDKECCLTSLEDMERVGAQEKVTEECPKGTHMNGLLCPSSYQWCEKSQNAEINPVYYKTLLEDCNQQPIGDIRECCINSVKTMEVVGGTVAHSSKDISTACDKGFERNMLNCYGSLAWCQTDLDNGINDNVTPPVPDTAQRTCTMEAKGCPDGTFVGRTGPNCEFAKCPGKPLKPDFVPTEFNQIELPDNVISEKDCAAAGGEVWNTLGETSYKGELIGRVDGLRCPCACLIKPEPSDIIWVDVDGHLEEFKGNLDDIKTYNDCKNAGFKIRDSEPETCTVGEPHMTGGRYKTFTNNPIKVGKNCTDYTYSNCPGSCVAKCTSSSCSDMGDGTTICTSDCDGVGSCLAK